MTLANALIFLVLLALNKALPEARAQILILEPSGAARKNNGAMIEGSTASFGAPFYGERVEGELLFFDVNGCQPEQYTLPTEVSNSTDTTRSNFIVMLRRGTCNFVAKVKVAQTKGAKAVIVADTKGSLSTKKEIQRIIVSDDGWGEAINIPSILLSDEDANFLISAGDGMYEENPPETRPERVNGRGAKTVILELVWSLPKDHAVQVDIWTTPSSIQSAKFMKEFAPFAHAFRDKPHACEHGLTLGTEHFTIDFQPHYWVMSMARDFHEMCTDATADFCAFDPDFSGKTTGKMVLEESVRQMCLWETTKALHPRNPHSGFYSPEWWSYMEALPDTCPHEDAPDLTERFGEPCSYKLMEKFQVNTRQVKKCYDEKFNTLLAHELVNRAWAPNAIIINKTRYSGSLDAELVTRAICTGFTCKCIQSEVHPPLFAYLSRRPHLINLAHRKQLAFAHTQPECENFIKNGQLIMMEKRHLSDGDILFICAGVVLGMGTLCFFLFWYLILPRMKRRLQYATFDASSRCPHPEASAPTAVYAIDIPSDKKQHQQRGLEREKM